MYGDKEGGKTFRPRNQPSGSIPQGPPPKLRKRAMFHLLRGHVRTGYNVRHSECFLMRSSTPHIETSEVTAAATATKTTELAGDAVRDIKHIRGGLIVNAVIGTGAGIVALATGKSLMESGKVTFQSMVPYGEAALKVAEGDKTGAVRATMTETAGLAGAIGGATGGAIAGAALGSVVPLIGTAIGGAVGGVVGGIAGGIGLGVGSDVLLSKVPAITEKVEKAVTATIGTLRAGMETEYIATYYQPQSAARSKPVAAETQKSVSAEPEYIATYFAQRPQAAPQPNPQEITMQQKDILHQAGLDAIERNGKAVDTEAILRDPAQRKIFIDNLEKSAKIAQTPEAKRDIEAMIKASRSFIALEDKRAAAAPAKNSSATPDSSGPAQYNIIPGI